MRLNILNASIEKLRNALKDKDRLTACDFTVCNPLGINLYTRYVGHGERIFTMSDDERVTFALLCLASEGIYY